MVWVQDTTIAFGLEEVPRVISPTFIIGGVVSTLILLSYFFRKV